MDGIVLWIIGVFFTWGILDQAHGEFRMWESIKAIVSWPYMLAKLLFTRDREGPADD